MEAVPTTPPKRSASAFDDGDDSPSAKRRRFATSPSQDSDENGQTPLGITFGDPPPVPAPIEGLEIEIFDSEEDAEKDKMPSKRRMKRSTKRNSAQDINNGKDSPDRASVSSLSIDDIPILTSSNDVQARLTTKYFTFNLSEVKAIVRWMRMHRTYKISSHKAEFNELMHHLGFTSALLSQKDQNELRTKLRTKMSALHLNMKRIGALTEEYDGYESAGSSVFRPLPFEEWTLMWYKKGWDGSLQRPDQKKYEAVMNDRVDHSATSKNAGKAESHGQVDDNSEQGVEQSHERIEEQAGATNTLFDSGFDGTELFVVEEPSEISPKEFHPSHRDDKPIETKGWNTYLLNKEIIDEHDWNYRVTTAQHLGIDLKDIAVLYPDPFPGYEPPPRESSAPATPTRSDATHGPSTPVNASSAQSKTTSRPDSDESISLEVTDFEDDDQVPGTRAIDYVSESDEDMGDDEMEEEDLVDDVNMEPGRQSQSSTANSGQRLVESKITTPTPTTPKRSISRQSHTPRSITPIYTAFWSPKD